ncbi:MAG: RsmB/NOP family class I SAM-dependent RNA methyltransferase [Gammaproteobacteria bacterium]|nr:RsmB/NOP family class I SAM-dependent RNA methyltransferase [Gammaproteobacteria bacterium]
MPASDSDLPALFLQRLEQMIPEESLGTCMASFSEIRPTSFRVNTLKSESSKLLLELQQLGLDVRPVKWMSGAFTLGDHGQRRRLTESPAFREGRLYIQGLASMLAPLLLDPKPGETVLDLAAAPGGKTLQIAAMMKNQGTLSAVESVKGRFFRLRANLALHGATMVKCYLMDGRAVGGKVPERFDRVLLDAPCSSEARFHVSKPESWLRWNIKKVRESARKQVRLLDSAVKSLRVGGRLVYCTCAFSPEENEEVIHRTLKRYPDKLVVDAIRLPISGVQNGIEAWSGNAYDPQVSQALRVLPTAEISGFFLCQMTKVSEGS